MLEFIPRNNLQKCYGGDDEWEYRYVEPVSTENERLNNVDEKNELQKHKDALVEKFHHLTMEWVSLEPEAGVAKAKNARRCEVAHELEQKYWQLDPYIRSTTYYDRVGVLMRDGAVDFGAAR